jgi:uncharacterized membrane protein HdeD (DUF308 family)
MKSIKTVWWMILIKGLALLFLGIAAVAWPGITLFAAAYIFALYVLIAGIVNTVHGIVGAVERKAWFLTLILGLVQIIAGIFVLRNPALTVVTFILVVGFMFLFQGILEIIVAFIEKDATEKVLDIIGGILGIIAGFFILRYPGAGGLAFVWVMGVYGIVVGSIQLAIALALHSAVAETIANSRGRVR